MTDFDVELWDSLARLRSQAEAWDRLWAASAVTIPTVRAEPLACWLEHFAPGTPLRILAVKQDGRLAAVLPLVEQRRGWLRCGEMPSNCWFVSGELLLDPDCDAPVVFDRLAEAVDRRLPWPVLKWDLVPYASPSWRAFAEALARRGLKLDTRKSYDIPVVEMGGDYATYESYEASRSRNLRRSLRKDWRKLEESGDVAFRCCEDFTDDEVESQLRTIFEIENRSWKGERGGSVLSTPGMFEFFVRQAKLSAAAGELRIALLEHAGRPIAFELGWLSKGVYHSFKVGYDEAYRRFGPGHLLRMELTRTLYANGDASAIDYQGPVTEALAPWSTRTYPVGRILVARRHPVGRLAWLGYRLASWRRRRCASDDEPRPTAATPTPEAAVTP